MKTILFTYLLINSISTMAQHKNFDTELPFSKSVLANDFLFISGQVGIDNTTGKLVNNSFEAETNQVMKNISLLLSNEGATFADLVNVTIYLKNMDNYPLTNKIYTTYFTGILPARVCIAVADLPAKANIEISATAKIVKKQSEINKETIKKFLETVRTGKAPAEAKLFMADTVLAHQVNVEEQTTVKRTPENYTYHVKEFLKMYGNFSFEITELLAEGDKVYARWIQKGKHLADIDGYAPTGKPINEIASAIYRLENNKIVEYWIQIDRYGFEKQLQENKK
ncbi:Rid family hydrolase [Parasediminibacterium sp. JCM 36343]|uniref:Rid family hydrolase n=1 Tax=Parasediminibacterium sp. JCM 36343 TaxID=3374279 RepID=UPI003979F982